MLAAGLLVLVLASVLHCWYAANAGTERGHAAGGFYVFGRGVVALSLLLLLISVVLIWSGSSFLWAAAELVAYFLVMPLIFVPILQRYYRPAPPGTSSHAEYEAKTAKWEAIAGVNDPPKKAPVANDFWFQLFRLLSAASDIGEKSVVVQAGELHRRVGCYPGPNHRMPVCCQVMRDEMQPGDVILEEPPKGSGARLTVRYQLPRLEKQVPS